MTFVEWFCRLRIVLRARSSRDNHRVAIPTTVTFLHQDRVGPLGDGATSPECADFPKTQLAWFSEAFFATPLRQ
jgi:hypothetical protein